MLSISSEQALALAPDTSSAQAGRKLGNPKQWRTLGYNAQALWGECQGSALYQVRVETGSLVVRCSCPSRKFPCKHGIGLLLIAATTPDALVEGEAPEWVASWLAKRAAAAETARARDEAAVAPPTAADTPPESGLPPAPGAARRIEKRERLVRDGLDTLDLWLNDLLRDGIGQAETQPSRFWFDQAKRLVDAQAPGLAGRVRGMAGMVNAGPHWPQTLLDALGQTALLSHAYRQQETLDAGLRADVRQLVGWTLGADEVDAAGDYVTDRWLVMGQWIADDDHLRTQRTWLLGERSGRTALVLQFSAGWRPFGDIFAPGGRFEGELRFWPSAYPIRARVASRVDLPAPASLLPEGRGYATIEAFLGEFARALGQQPWLDRLGCALRGVTPIPASEGPWLVVDTSGAALPLADDDHWRLLAISGGAPIELLGEWNGERLLPLGAFAEGVYTPLWGGDA